MIAMGLYAVSYKLFCTFDFDFVSKTGSKAYNLLLYSDGQSSYDSPIPWPDLRVTDRDYSTKS